MDSLEEYIALIARENHVILDRKDSICILHTILAKFERDLLESQRKILDDFSGKIETLCLELDLAEKARSEKALSFARSSAEQLMKSIPTTMKATVEETSFKKLLAQTALATLKDQMSVIVHIPRKVWIGGSVLALLNLLSLFLFLINVICREIVLWKIIQRYSNPISSVSIMNGGILDSNLLRL